MSEINRLTDEELDFYAKHPVSIDDQIGQQLARELLAHRRATPTTDLRAAVYVASKVKHATEWKAKRAKGYLIISTWIDESEVGETLDWPDLWLRCIGEASRCSALVLISRDGDVLKGAWAEAGAALASGKPIYAVGCDSFTIRHHPLFFSCGSEDEAFDRAALSQNGGEV